MSGRFVIALASLASLAPMSHAADPLIPIDHFIREDEYAKPQLSPDGKHLALTIRLSQGNRFVPTIAVYSLPEMKQITVIQFTAGIVPLAYSWVSNTRLVYSKGKEYGSLEAPSSTGEVLSMDFDGGNHRYIYGWDAANKSRYADRYTDNYGFGWVMRVNNPPNGRFFLGTDTGADSFVYDASGVTGARKLLATISHPGLSYVLQNDGTPRFAEGSDKVRNATVLYRHDPVKDEWKIVGNDDAAADLSPFAFTEDDKEFVATAGVTTGPEELVRQNLQSGKRISLLKHPVGNINLFQWGGNRQVPFGAASQIGIPTVTVLDETLPEAKLYKLLSSKFPGQYVSFINTTTDGNKVLFVVRSDREPGAYFIFDRSTGKAFPLFNSRQDLDPELMAERRPIQFKARDGLELHGYITLPRRSDGKKPPLILLPHGGPHGPYDSWFYDNDAQFLASRGYAVLQVNFRGSGGRGNPFEHSGYRHWGDDIMNDLIDGVRWSIKQGMVDEQRICSFGASFGGYSALMITTRAPELFKCAVGYAGVYDLNLLVADAGPKSTARHSIFNDYLGTDKAQLDAFSPAMQAHKIKVPVLLVHGENDERAKFEHAKVMRAALQKAGNEPEWMAVPNEGHGFFASKNVKAFYERLETFLAKHIGN